MISLDDPSLDFGMEQIFTGDKWTYAVRSWQNSGERIIHKQVMTFKKFKFKYQNQFIGILNFINF
jgi:hypothetical protein